MQIYVEKSTKRRPGKYTQNDVRYLYSKLRLSYWLSITAPRVVNLPKITNSR